MEKGYTLNVRYQNGQTATDKAPHQRLLKKLSCPCDRRKVLLLIISRLKDMAQKAGPHGHFSGWWNPWWVPEEFTLWALLCEGQGEGRTVYTRSCSSRKEVSSERNCFRRLLKYILKKTVQQMLNFCKLLSDDITKGEIKGRFRQTLAN